MQPEDFQVNKSATVTQTGSEITAFSFWWAMRYNCLLLWTPWNESHPRRCSILWQILREVGQVAQSESPKALRWKGDEAGKNYPWLRLFLRYLKIPIATWWGELRGLDICWLSCWTTKDMSGLVLVRKMGTPVRRDRK